jgi:hypothetical protein
VRRGGVRDLGRKVNNVAFAAKISGFAFPSYFVVEKSGEFY